MPSKNRIAEMRKRHGLSQSGLAKMLGVAQNTVSNWENHSREPDIETLKKLSILLDCSVGYLIGVEDERGMIDIGLLQLDLAPKLGVSPESKEAESAAQKRVGQIFFDEKLISIQKALEKLNINGQKEAVKRIEELTEIPKYRRSDD